MTTVEEVEAELRNVLEKVRVEEETHERGNEYLYRLKMNYAQLSDLRNSLVRKQR